MRYANLLRASYRHKYRLGHIPPEPELSMRRTSTGILMQMLPSAKIGHWQLDDTTIPVLQARVRGAHVFWRPAFSIDRDSLDML